MDSINAYAPTEGPHKETNFLGIGAHESFTFDTTATWHLLERNTYNQISVIADKPYTTKNDIKDKDGNTLFPAGHTFQKGEKIPIFVSDKALQELKQLEGKTWNILANPAMGKEIDGRVSLTPAK